MRFCIRWLNYGYVSNLHSNLKPYTQEKHDPATKTWMNRKNAERFLQLKDRKWASECVIEELD